MHKYTWFVSAIVFLAAHGVALAQTRTTGLAELQGVWQIVSVAGSEEAAETDFAALPRWVIKDNKVIYGGEELATLTVDASTTPPTVDLGFVNPTRLFEGVYAVDETTLKICVNRNTEGPRNGRWNSRSRASRSVGC